MESVLLSRTSLERIEAVRLRVGLGSAAEVIDDAVAAYARLRDPRDLAAYRQLSPRLREVLRLISEGATTKQIAADLKVSLKTVEFHRARLMRALDIHGIAGLVRFAVRVGAVAP